MLDAAFRQIAGAVSAAVGGPYHDGKLLYSIDAEYDDGGAIITPGRNEEVDCTIQVDVVTEDMRLDAGFLARDVRMLILGPVALDTTPNAKVIAGPFAGQTYSLQTCGRDTLGFGWECRARQIGGL